MNNRDIAKLGVQIASEDLGISEIVIIFKDSAFFYNSEINAMFMKETYSIVFNENWLGKADVLEVFKCAFHETRHAYQRACIGFPEIMKHDEKEVQSWKEEFEQYKNPDFKGYAEQAIEKDAIKYSEIMLQKLIEDAEEDIENEKLEKINVLYSKVKKVNDDLMKKSNSEDGCENVEFNEIMEFYITSNAMSFLRYIVIGEKPTYSAIFNARCLVEGFAILEMYKKGDISKEKEQLFKAQYNLLEYRMYIKYPMLEGKSIYFEKLKADYKKSLDIFKREIKDDKKLKKIIKSKIPFLCDEKISFEKIIEKYLSEDHLELYKISSLFSHPHDYGNYTNIDFNNYYDLLINDINLEFSDISNQEENNLRNSLGLIYHRKNSIINNIFDSTTKQVEKIRSIAKSFEEKMGNNFITNVLNEIAKIHMDLTHDLLLGMGEQLKIKWKLLIEMMATLDYIYFNDLYNAENHYQLLKHHTLHKLKQNLNLNSNDELEDGYNSYAKIFSNVECDIAEFKVKFNSSLGFTVTKNSNIKSLNDFVFTYIAKEMKDIINEQDILISDIMKIYYEESQMLSHANGYLYFSNSAAWTEYKQVYMSYENLFCVFLEKILNLYKLHETIEGNSEYKKVIDRLSNGISYIKKLSRKKSTELGMLKK